MSKEELADLRNDLFRLHALVSATAETAASINGQDAAVERTQALLGVTEEASEKILRRIEASLSVVAVAA